LHSQCDWVRPANEATLPATIFRGRRAAAIENDHLRVTVLQEGGHIAEILDKQTGVNPLWIPPWPSIEPSTFNADKHREFGTGSDARLLAGIMGHSVCLDIFGGPSADEAAAGITVHGEASVDPYEIADRNGKLALRIRLPLAQLRFERSIELHDRALRIQESVENLTACDRPIAWTQHVTLGPPFLERGATQFRASASRSKVYETDFGANAYLKSAAEFDWPMAPQSVSGAADLRVMNSAPASSGFTTHLMDPQREDAFFVAFAPALRLALGYIWNRADFPWLGIWEENCSRTETPWSGKTIARGMEFGVSPFPESRKQMVDRGRLFGVPTYRWLPAKGRLHAEYWATLRGANSIPDSLDWPARS
jgi:hypothetical protein